MRHEVDPLANVAAKPCGRCRPRFGVAAAMNDRILKSERTVLTGRRPHVHRSADADLQSLRPELQRRGTSHSRWIPRLEGPVGHISQHRCQFRVGRLNAPGSYREWPRQPVSRETPTPLHYQFRPGSGARKRNRLHVKLPSSPVLPGSYFVHHLSVQLIERARSLTRSPRQFA
jgi:hypothetical protein